MEDLIKFYYKYFLGGLVIFLSLLLLFSSLLKVVSLSMEPTLATGDIVLVESFSLWAGEPERGDLIVYVDPRQKDHPKVVKRIVGIPEENLFIKDDIISVVNKYNYQTTFSKDSTLGRRDNGVDYQIVLGKDDFFLMGDNRAGSRDSRQTGTIQPHEMFGKPYFIIYPLSRFGFIF